MNAKELIKALRDYLHKSEPQLPVSVHDEKSLEAIEKTVRKIAKGLVTKHNQSPADKMSCDELVEGMEPQFACSLYMYRWYEDKFSLELHTKTRHTFLDTKCIFLTAPVEEIKKQILSADFQKKMASRFREMMILHLEKLED